MEWYIIAGIIGLIIGLFIIFIKRRNGDKDDFIGMAVHRIDLGCGKLIKKIRGC